MTCAIEIDGLELGWGSKTVLRGLSMAVDAGEVVAVVGPSGSGKSTLVRAILGLATPRRGAIRIHGRRVSEDARIIVPPEERRLAVVFQDLALWPHMTVARHLDFVMAASGVGRGERRCRAAAVLEQVGLAHQAAALPGELSGGERQRVALARAWVQEPAALLLDEPFSSLDVALKEELIGLLRKLLHEKGLSTILVAHNPWEAVALSRRMVVLEAGRLRAAGTLEELRRAPGSRFLDAFLKALPPA